MCMFIGVSFLLFVVVVFTSLIMLHLQLQARPKQPDKSKWQKSIPCKVCHYLEAITPNLPTNIAPY